ncbi:MlaD family protein [Chitinibacteraceae bacterium HSL-7]
MKQSHYIRLGLFIIGAMVIGFVFLLAFGAGNWMSKSIRMETYFDESVQGLDVGSAVKYRGVALGNVSAIRFTGNKYEREPGQPQYVLVEMELKPDRFSPGNTKELTQEVLDEQIRRGMRISLAMQGLTGTSYLEIDYADPKNNPHLPIAWTPDELYIPSAHSTVTQIVAASQNVVAKLEKLDFAATLNKLDTVLDTANQQLAAAELGKVSASIQRVAHELERANLAATSQKAAKLLDELSATNTALQARINAPEIDETFKALAETANSANARLNDPALTQTIANLQSTTAQLKALLGPRNDQLGTMLDDLSETSTRLRELSTQLARQPSSLVFSSEPTPYPLSR